MYRKHRTTPYLDKRDCARQHAIHTLCIEGRMATVDSIFFPDVLVRREKARDDDEDECL